jgi:pimeloyl-ACP methyl ester carboxylesterase
VTELTEALSNDLPEADKRAMLKYGQVGQYMVDVFQESLRTNCDGWVDDNLESVQPWGFELSEVKVPVLLYQGSEDKSVPFAHGEWLAKHLPVEKLRKHLLEDQGHLSIVLEKKDAMIDELLAVTKP